MSQPLKCILALWVLLFAGCTDSSTEIGLITGIEVSEPSSTILLHVSVAGSARHLIIEKLRPPVLHAYFASLVATGGEITDLDVRASSYGHTYSDGSVQYDSIQIFTSVPKDVGNAPRVTPGIVDHELPFKSMHFVSEGTAAPPKLVDGRAFPVAGGKLIYSQSTGRHFGRIPHKSPP